jgi:hypothetical protein
MGVCSARIALASWDCSPATVRRFFIAPRTYGKGGFVNPSNHVAPVWSNACPVIISLWDTATAYDSARWKECYGRLGGALNLCS